jgi:hypothetical protein
MGVTIAYRGRLADLTRIEDFEDRLIDLARELGSQVRLWRTWADRTPERMVRGVILDLAPGHESTSLLIAPEGWLINLTEIEDAENCCIDEPPWCFVKTQFGPVEGHVTLVELLAALKREFLPDLEVSDEGGCWETRDLGELVRKRSLTQAAIDGLAEGLRRHGISREAAEDPEILARHVERVAEYVHKSLTRPPEHPPVAPEDGDDFSGAADQEAAEKLWDELCKHSRRQQERMLRIIEERRSLGVDVTTAYRDALREVVQIVPHENTELSDEPWSDDKHAVDESLAGEETEDPAGVRQADDDPFGDAIGEHHPLLQRAMDLLDRLDTLIPESDRRSDPAVNTLYQGASDTLGGLARALAGRDDDAGRYGVRVVQLKRALRGAAFAHGGLFPLRSTMSADHFDELLRTLKQMETDIVVELGKVRSEHREADL